MSFAPHTGTYPHGIKATDAELGSVPVVAHEFHGVELHRPARSPADTITTMSSCGGSYLLNLAEPIAMSFAPHTGTYPHGIKATDAELGSVPVVAHEFHGVELHRPARSPADTITTMSSCGGSYLRA